MLGLAFFVNTSELNLQAQMVSNGQLFTSQRIEEDFLHHSQLLETSSTDLNSS